MPFSTMTEEGSSILTSSPSHLVPHKKEEWQNEAECSVKCRSKKDATILIAAITRGTDQQSLGYISTAGICRNPGKVSDQYGRTLLHIAASTGKKAVIEWLIKYKGAHLNTKDLESGYTALHRALYYGHINAARFLIESGSNINVQDNEGLTPIDHINKDRASFCPFLLEGEVTSESNQPSLSAVAGGLGEVYVWGTNENFNLGLGHHNQRNQPTLLEQLRRSNIYISKVVLQKFHSAILTTEGAVLTFGHGQGGRLGHGNEDSQLTPRYIATLKDNVSCTDIALGVDHSMFLTSKGTIWVCGSNAYYQLGLSGTAQSANVVSPQSIGGGKISSGNATKSSSEKQSFSSAIGIAASRYHSLFWTKDSLYTWGLDAGQLGHIKSENTTYITTPKLVSSLNQKDIEISSVTCSEGAIVVLTTLGDLYALYEYQSKKRITSKRIPDITKVLVIGGHLDPSRAKHDEVVNHTKLTEKGGRDLKVFVLTKRGKIYVWEDTTSSGPGLVQCVFNLSRELLVQDIAINRTNILIISKDGNGYEAVHVNRTKHSVSTNQKQSSQMLAKSPHNFNRHDTFYDLIRIKQRMLGVHRGVSIVCDPKGKNFGVLQVAPNAVLFDLPDIMESNMNDDMKNLFDENLEDIYSPLHDLLVNVSFGDTTKSYKVHAFILASTSQDLAAMIKESITEKSALDKTGSICLELNDVRPELFEQCLKYAYTRTCDLINAGPCNFKITSENKKETDIFEESRLELYVKDMTIIDRNNVDENSSAYNVQQSYKRKKKKQAQSEKLKEKQKHHKEKEYTLNPLVLLNDLSKKIGMLGLCQQISNFKYLGDCIVDTRQQFWCKKYSAVNNSFTRKSCPELHDITIISEDAVEFSAHRCILSARLEYFNSMFSLGWIETGKNKKLNLPVPSKVLVVILEYIYKDETPLLDKSDDVEFVCQVLAVADQLLAVRLVQMCERQASSLLTLKNCAEILQVANDYSAIQLVRSTSQFICQNLATLLESRSLDYISEECVDKLTRYYFDSFRTLYHRRITPFDNAPSSEQLENIEISIEHVFAMEEELELSRKHTNINMTDDLNKKPKSSSHKNRRQNSSGDCDSSGDDKMVKVGKGNRRRNRKHSCESTSSLGSSDSEEDVTSHPVAKYIEQEIDDFGLIEREQDPPFIKVQDKREHQRKSSEFVSSLLRLPYKLEKPETILTAPPILKAPVSPSEINKNNEPELDLQSSSSSKMAKFTKLTQKERKRLNSEQSQMTSKNPHSNQSPGIDQPKWIGWGHKISSPIETQCPSQVDHDTEVEHNASLENIMKIQSNLVLSEQTNKSKNISKPKQTIKKPKSWRTLDLDDSPTIMKIAPLPSSNPWNITNAQDLSNNIQVIDYKCKGTIRNLEKQSETATLQDIMHQEALQNGNLHRAQSKSLAVTQLEERAIEELKLFYNADNVFDELITVGRANPHALATPVWNAKRN